MVNPSFFLGNSEMASNHFLKKSIASLSLISVGALSALIGTQLNPTNALQTQPLIAQAPAASKQRVLTKTLFQQPLIKRVLRW